MIRADLRFSNENREDFRCLELKMCLPLQNIDFNPKPWIAKYPCPWIAMNTTGPGSPQAAQAPDPSKYH